MEDLLKVAGSVVVVVVTLAPVITAAINRFGSPKVKLAWSSVRKIYNRAYAKRLKEDVDVSNAD